MQKHQALDTPALQLVIDQSRMGLLLLLARPLLQRRACQCNLLLDCRPARNRTHPSIEGILTKKQHLDLSSNMHSISRIRHAMKNAGAACTPRGGTDW